ncbi:MAG: YbjN domain-containing protein [Clostridia bacterium]|nr:YbjN domain-containing protein [Clostridia bacterium]
MADTQKIKLAQKNFKALCAMLDDNKWKYEKDEEQLMINCGAKGDDMTINIRIKLNPDLELATLYSPMPFDVPESKRSIIALAVARANYGMVDGSFDFKYTTGRILFRLTASYASSILSKEAFEYMLFVSCHTVDEYNDKFLTVCKKDMTVAQLFDLIK